MCFGILGPIEVRAANDEPVPVGGPRPRSLLAVFLLDPGRLISTDRLIDAIYGDAPPHGAANALQSQVSRLRRTLGAGDLIERHPAGYRLAVDPDQIDAHRFAELAAQGRQALADRDPHRAADLLDAALDLWRGPALAAEELADMRWRRAERLLRIGDLAAAEADFRTSAELARTGRLPVTLMQARRGLGEVARIRGDLPAARHWQELALRGDGTDWLSTSVRARVLTALGRITEAEGDLAEAVRQHQAAIASARDNRNAAGLADTIAGLAGAVAPTDPLRAARLLGIAQTLLGAPLVGDPDIAGTASALVVALGAKRYAALTSAAR